MLARRGVWTTNIAGIAFGMATFGSFPLVPLLLQLPAATGYGMLQLIVLLTQAGP